MSAYVSIKNFRNGVVGVKRTIKGKDYGEYILITDLVCIGHDLKPLKSSKCSLSVFDVRDGKYDYYEMSHINSLGFIKYRLDKKTRQPVYDSVELTFYAYGKYDDDKQKIRLVKIKELKQGEYSLVVDKLLKSSIKNFTKFYQNSLLGQR